MGAVALCVFMYHYRHDYSGSCMEGFNRSKLEFERRPNALRKILDKVLPLRGLVDSLKFGKLLFWLGDLERMAGARPDLDRLLGG